MSTHNLCMKTQVVGTHQKHLSETLLMSTHNLCFHAEIRKISIYFGWKNVLSVAMFLTMQADLRSHWNNS